MRKFNRILATLLSLTILTTSIFVTTVSASSVVEFKDDVDLMSYQIVDTVTGTPYTPKTDFEGSAVIAVFGTLQGGEGKIKASLKSIQNILNNTATGAVCAVYFDIVGESSSSISNFMQENNFHNDIISCADNNNQNNRYVFNTLNADNIIVPTVFLFDGNGKLKYYTNSKFFEHNLTTALNNMCGNWIFNDEYKNYYYDNLASNKQMFNSTFINEEMRTAFTTVVRDSENVPLSVDATFKKYVEVAVGDAKTDYEKVKNITKWIAENIYYDNDYLYGRKATTNDTLIDVLNNRVAVCRGYAILMNNFCRTAGIPCHRVYGYTRSDGQWTYDLVLGDERFEQNHVWNEVYVDGRWIIVDATWNSNNRYEYGEKTYFESIDDYFDIDIESFSSDHHMVEGGDIIIDTETNYKYVNSNNGVFLAGYNGKIPQNVTLPSEIDGKAVGGFKQLAFYIHNISVDGAQTLGNVTVPNTAVVFQDGSFYGNYYLKSINIPYGAIIKDDAFGVCGYINNIATIYGYANSSAQKYVENCTLANTYLNFATKDCSTLGHTQGEWKVTTNATCTTDGTRTLYCEACAYELDTDTISSSGHKYRWQTNGEVVNGSCVVCSETTSKINGVDEPTTTTTTSTTSTTSNLTTTTTTTTSTTTTTTTTTTQNPITTTSTKPTATTTTTTKNTTTSSTVVVIGDVNGDGYVNSFDIMLIKRAIVYKKVDEKMDINNDGIINSFDIMLVKRKILYSM